MRRWVTPFVVVVALLAACAPETTPTQTDAPTGSELTCTPEAMQTLTPGVLKIGTGNPAYPPWYEGGSTRGTEWQINNPETGEGFESAVAYAVAEELGFDRMSVVWAAVPFTATFAPGPKDFDFAIQQISYKAKRAQAVDFSESYYDVNQAVIAPKGSPIANATSIADLQDAKLGAPIGTTSLDTINEVVQPTERAAVYDDQNGAVQDLKNGQIDGIVVDLPTAFYITAVQAPGAKIVGQFPAGDDQEYFGMTFDLGSPLVPCVNQALQSLKASGELSAIQQEWLAENTSVPVLTG